MVGIVLENSRQGTKAQVYGCNVPGCKRHYDPYDGYFDIGGKLSTAAFICGEHEARLHLDSYETGEEIWRCPVESCPTEKKLLATDALKAREAIIESA